MAQHQAGANWGQVFTPRIGTEVAIGYLDDDIDRPIVTGQHYNAAHLPPWSAGEGSGANHPGVINGIRSQTLDGAGHNHWLVDDTPGQLRTRLASSHGQSELILGEGIAHNPLSSTRGAWRGMGAELGTQGWGSLRAPKGLTLTTQARAGSYGSAQGTQMDAPEALAQVKAATDLGQRLTQASTPGGAQALKTHDPKKAVDSWIEDTDPKKKGKHPSHVSGQEALAPKSGRQLEDPVPRPDRPYLLLDSPSSLAHASPGDVVSVSGQNTTRVSQGDQHEAAAHTAVQVSGKHTSLYTHEGELQVKAAAGPVSLHAHSDTLEILADQSVQILSVNDSIRIQAKDKIEIVAGDSTLVLQGGDINFFTPGTFLIKSAIHDFKGGGSGPAVLPLLPPKPNAPVHWVELNFRDVAALPMQGAAYTLRFKGGTVVKCKLDDQGFARIEGVPYEEYTVEYGEAEPEAKPRHVRDPNPFFGSGVAPSAESASAKLQAYIEQEEAWLQDNFFLDEIEAMQAPGGEADPELYLDDYEMSEEQLQGAAVRGYWLEHPEGKA